MQRNNPNFSNQHGADVQHQFYQAGGSEAPQGTASQQQQGGNTYDANMGGYINNNMPSSMQPGYDQRQQQRLNQNASFNNSFEPNDSRMEASHSFNPTSFSNMNMNLQMASLSVATNVTSYQRQSTPTVRHQGTQVTQSSGIGERGRSRNDGPATSMPVDYPSRNRRFQGIPESSLNDNDYDFDSDYFAQSPNAAAIQRWAPPARNNAAQQQHAFSVPTTRVVQEQVQTRQPLQPLRHPNQFVATPSNQPMVPVNSNIYDQRQLSQQQQYDPRLQIPTSMASTSAYHRPAHRQVQQQQRYLQPSQPMQHQTVGPSMPQGGTSPWRQSVNNNAYRHDQFRQSVQRPRNTNVTATFAHQTVNQPMYNRNQFPRSLPAPVPQNSAPPMAQVQSGNNLRIYPEQYRQQQPSRYETLDTPGWQSISPAAAASNSYISRISDSQEFINAEDMDPANDINAMLLMSPYANTTPLTNNQVPVDEQLTQYPTATSMTQPPYAFANQQVHPSQQYQFQMQLSQQPQLQARPATAVAIESQSTNYAPDQFNQSWEFQAQPETAMTRMPSYETGGNGNGQRPAQDQWTTSAADQNLVSMEADNATQREEQFAPQTSSIYQVPAEQQFASLPTERDPVPTASMSEPIYEFDRYDIPEEAVNELMDLVEAQNNQQIAEASTSVMPPADAADNSQIDQSAEKRLTAPPEPIYNFDFDSGFEMQQQEQFLFGEVVGEDEYPVEASSLGRNRGHLDQVTAEQQSSTLANQDAASGVPPALYSSNSSSSLGQGQQNSTISPQQEVRMALSPDAEKWLAPEQELIQQPLSLASVNQNMDALETPMSPTLSSDSSAFSLLDYIENGQRSSARPQQPGRTSSPLSNAKGKNNLESDQVMVKQTLSPASSDQNVNLTSKSPTWPTLSPDSSDKSSLGHTEGKQRLSPPPQQSGRTPSTPSNAEVKNDLECDQEMVEQPLSPASAIQNIKLTEKSPTWPTLSPDPSDDASFGLTESEQQSSPQPHQPGRATVSTPSNADNKDGLESDQEMVEQSSSPSLINKDLVPANLMSPVLSSDSSASSEHGHLESEERSSPQPQESGRTTPSTPSSRDAENRIESDHEMIEQSAPSTPSIRDAEDDIGSDQDMVEQQLISSSSNQDSAPAATVKLSLSSDFSCAYSPLSELQNDLPESLSPHQSGRITPLSSNAEDEIDYFAAFTGQEQSVFPQLLNRDLVTVPTLMSRALSSDSSSQRGPAEIEQPAPSPQQSGRTTPSTPSNRGAEDDIESDQEIMEQQLSPASVYPYSAPAATVRPSLFSDSSGSSSPLSQPQNDGPQSLSPQHTVAPLIPYPLSSDSSASSPLGQVESKLQSSPSPQQSGNTTPSSRPGESDLETNQDMVDQELASTHLDLPPAATARRSLFSDSSASSSPLSQIQKYEQQSGRTTPASSNSEILPSANHGRVSSVASTPTSIHGSEAQQEEIQFEEPMELQENDNDVAMSSQSGCTTPSSSSSSDYADIFGSDEEMDEQSSPAVANQDSAPAATVSQSLFSDSDDSSSPINQPQGEEDEEMAKQPSPVSVNHDIPSSSSPVSSSTPRASSQSGQVKRKMMNNVSTEKMKLLATIRNLQNDRSKIENVIEQSLPALAHKDPVNPMSPAPSLHPLYSPTKRKKLLARLNHLQSTRLILDIKIAGMSWVYHQDTLQGLLQLPKSNAVNPVPKPVATAAPNAALPLPVKPQPDPLTKWPAPEEVEQALRTLAQPSTSTTSTATTSNPERPKISPEDIEYTNRRLMEIIQMNRDTSTASSSASKRRENRAFFGSPAHACVSPSQDTSPADPADSTQSNECVTSPVSSQKDGTVAPLSKIFKTAVPVEPFSCSKSLDNSTTSDSSNASRFSKSNESSNSAVSTSTSSEERTQNISLGKLTEEERKKLFSNYVVPERPETMASELDTSTSDDQSIKQAETMAYATSSSSMTARRTQKPRNPYLAYLQQESSDDENILSLWTKASVPIRENQRKQKPKGIVQKDTDAADSATPVATDSNVEKLKTADDIINYINDQQTYGPAVNNQMVPVNAKKVEVALVARLLSVVDKDDYKNRIGEFATGEMSLFSTIHEDCPKSTAGCSIPVEHLLSRFKLYIENMRYLYTVNELPKADFEYERTQSKSFFCIPPTRQYGPSFFYAEFRTIGETSRPLSRCTEFRKYEIYMLVDLHMLYAQKFLLSEKDYSAYVETHRAFLHKILKVVNQSPCNKRFQVLLEAARILDTPAERIELAGVLFEKEFKRMTVKMNEYIAMTDNEDFDRLDNNYHTYVMDAIFETDPRGCVEEPDLWYTVALGSHMNDIFYLLEEWNPLADVIAESLKTELDKQRKQLYQCPDNFWSVLINPNLWKRFLGSPVVPPTHVDEKYKNVKEIVRAVKNGTHAPAKSRPYASSIPISVPLRREVNEYSLKLQLMKNVEFDDSSLLQHIKVVLIHFVRTLFPVLRNDRNLPFTDRYGKQLSPALNNATISLLTDFVMNDFLREWEKYGKSIGKRFDNNCFAPKRPGFQRVHDYFNLKSYYALPTFLKQATVYLNNNGFDFYGHSLTAECRRYFKTSKVRLLPGYMVGKMIAFFSQPLVEKEEDEPEMIAPTDEKLAEEPKPKPSLFAELKQTAEEYCAKQSANEELDFGPMALAWPKDDQGFGKPIMPERPAVEVSTEIDIPPAKFCIFDYKGKLVVPAKHSKYDIDSPGKWRRKILADFFDSSTSPEAQKLSEADGKSRKRRLAERDTVSPSEGPAPKISAPETATADRQAKLERASLSYPTTSSSAKRSFSSMDEDFILRKKQNIEKELQKQRMFLEYRQTGVFPFVISPSKVPEADKNEGASTNAVPVSELSAPDHSEEPSSSEIATSSVSAAEAASSSKVPASEVSAPDNSTTNSTTPVSKSEEQALAEKLQHTFALQRKILKEREKIQRYYLEKEALARRGASSEVSAPWYGASGKQPDVRPATFYSTKHTWVETLDSSALAEAQKYDKEMEETWRYLTPTRKSLSKAPALEAPAPENTETDVEMVDNAEAETPAAPSSPKSNISDSEDFEEFSRLCEESRKKTMERIANLSFSEPGFEDIVAAKVGTIPGSTVPKDLRPYTCPAPLFAICTKKHSMIVEVPQGIRKRVRPSDIKNHPVWDALHADDPESVHRHLVGCIQEQVGITIQNSFKYEYTATENMYRWNKAIQTMHKIRENGLENKDQLMYREDLEAIVGILLPFDMREHVQFNSFCCINIEASSIKIQHSTLDLDYYAKRNASIFVPATRRRIPATFEFNNPRFMKNSKPSNWRTKSVL